MEERSWEPIMIFHRLLFNSITRESLEWEIKLNVSGVNGTDFFQLFFQIFFCFLIVLTAGGIFIFFLIFFLVMHGFIEMGAHVQITAFICALRFCPSVSSLPPSLSPSLSLSVYLSICPPVPPSIHLSIHLYLSTYLSIYLYFIFKGLS